MPAVFEVAADDIQALDARELTDLVRRLFLLEAHSSGVARGNVHVPLAIDIPDGGEDGRIAWDGPPEPTGRLLARRICVQVKATPMSTAKCTAEVLVEAPKTRGTAAPRPSPTLKPRVQAALAEGAAYFLVCGKEQYTTEAVAQRKLAVREGFRKAGVQYPDACVVEILDAQLVAEWCNEHLAAQVWVLRARRRDLPASCLTWAEWLEEHGRARGMIWHEDAARTAAIADLRSRVGPDRSVARVVGLSGLGKTRLVIEAFRPPPSIATDPVHAAWAARAVFIPNGADIRTELLNAMREWKRRRIPAIVVVDECPLNLHKDLSHIVEGESSCLSLVTMDFEPDSKPSSPDHLFIALERLPLEVIKKILKDQQPGVPDEVLNKVAEFAQGFPRMARLLLDAASTSDAKLWDVADDDLVERLLSRRTPLSQAGRQVLQALAAVEHLGVDGDVEGQLTALCHHMCTNVDRRQGYEIIAEYSKAGLAYRRGDFVRLTPLPLALHLAAKWWTGRSKTDLSTIMREMPTALRDVLAQQVRRLRGHQDVEERVEAVLGDDSPFATWESVNSPTGSRVLTCLSEVSPRAVVGAIRRALSAAGHEDLRALSAGRRDLIWCLERVCWWAETFDDGAEILLHLAAAENENYSNNATGTLRQLFHIRLSGTELPAIDRLAVIDRALTSKIPERRRMAHVALCAAFTAGHFSRSGGVDSQGAGFSRPDWAPRTYGEIWRYWHACLDRVLPALCAEDTLGAEVRSGIAQHTRAVLMSGGLPVVSRAVDAVVQVRESGWPEMLHALRASINYEGAKMPPDVRAEVERLIASLEPRSISERLLHTVTRPPWGDLRKNPDGTITRVAEERARALGSELGKTWEAVRGSIEPAMTGEQRQGFRFGHALGHAVPDPAALVEDLLAVLRRLRADIRNPLVLMGALSAWAERFPSAVEPFLDRIAGSDELRWLLLDCSQALEVDPRHVVRVLGELESGRMTIGPRDAWALGRLTIPCSGAQMGQVVDAVMLSGDAAFPVAIDILGMFLHRYGALGEAVAAAERLIGGPGRLVLAAALGDMVSHNYEELLKRVLLENPGTPIIAGLARDFVVASARGVEADRHLLTTVLEMVLSHDLDAAWAAIGPALLSGDLNTSFWLQRIFREGDHGGFGEDDGASPIGGISVSFLMSWGRSDARAPAVVASMCRPLRDPTSGALYPSWSSLATALLDEFGEDDDVRSVLSASAFSGGWGGSAVPFYERRYRAFRELRSHPSEAVREWARRNSDAAEADIAREKKRDEEVEFGIRR